MGKMEVEEYVKQIGTKHTQVKGYTHGYSPLNMWAYSAVVQCQCFTLSYICKPFYECPLKAFKDNSSMTPLNLLK